MALELNGTTGVSLVQDGVVTAADLASGAITSAALPTGNIVDVESFSTSSHTTRSGVADSTGTTDVTGLSSLSYTLKSSSNSLIIAVCLNWSGGGTGSSSAFMTVTDGGSNILGSGSILAQGTSSPHQEGSQRAEQMNCCFAYTPNSSSVSLTVAIGAPLGGGGVTVNGDYLNSQTGLDLRSSLTIYEVQA